MCIRDRHGVESTVIGIPQPLPPELETVAYRVAQEMLTNACLLYTSDAADERSSVDLGGRRIIKKKITNDYTDCLTDKHTHDHRLTSRQLPTKKQHIQI